MRALSLIPVLRAHGHEVHVHSSGDAVAMLHGLEGVQVDCLGPGPRLAPRFAARMAADLRVLRHLRPDVVITDGDAPSLHAAAALRIPSIAVGHGLLFAHCRLPIELPFRERLREAINAASASWLARRVIVVHFGTLDCFDPRAVVARPDPRPDLATDRVRGDALVVYAGQADLSGYVRELHRRGHPLVVFGCARSLPDGVVAQAPDVTRFAAALSKARGVVGTAGSNLVAEAAALGRPLLLVAPAHMIEQQVNARLAERDAFAVAASAEEIDIEAIERFEAMLGRDVPKNVPPNPTVSEAVLACLAELAPTI
ncbi:MAG: hypothetical protein AMS21_01285 [Gemmatimonas sp. SG8_38_2]|nr:MAG: hypothetical protein AMS21_01285 [Gemmatimonas sp. SG8_38_2]